MANRDALNYEAIKKAKDKHDKECEFPGRRLLMHPIDIERLDWTEGESIAGLVVTADNNRSTGTFWVECDGQTGGGKDEADVSEDVDAVSRERDLVPA